MDLNRRQVKLSAGQVARMWLEFGPRSGPLYRQLSQGLSELIDLGELPPGAILPPERALAAALAVSRTTVVAAYKQLQEWGRVERRQGSGTRVRPGSTGVRETVLTSSLPGEHVANSFIHDPQVPLDLSSAALPALPLVAEVAGHLGEEQYLRLMAHNHGYYPRGLPGLLERLAECYCDAGVFTSEDQLLVTSGAQQALELLARGCLHPADDVVVEDPTYRGALEALAATGCRLHAVPCDAEGLDVGALEHLVRSIRPRLIYVQSPVHNPTGAVLAAHRRERLARLVDGCETILVDDTSLDGLFIDSSAEVRVPLASQVGTTRFFTIGSMSKLFWNGLRIGWVRGSAREVARLSQMKGAADLGTSVVSQAIAVQLLDHLDEARRERQAQLSDGLVTLTEFLAETLPEWSWQQPRGGAALWVNVPRGNVTQLAQVCARFGVSIAPGSVFSVGGVDSTHMRIPYIYPRSTMRAAVRRMGLAWETYSNGEVTSQRLAPARD